MGHRMNEDDDGVWPDNLLCRFARGEFLILRTRNALKFPAFGTPPPLFPPPPPPPHNRGEVMVDGVAIAGGQLFQIPLLPPPPPSSLPHPPTLPPLPPSSPRLSPTHDLQKSFPALSSLPPPLSPTNRT